MLEISFSGRFANADHFFFQWLSRPILHTFRVIHKIHILCFGHLCLGAPYLWPEVAMVSHILMTVMCMQLLNVVHVQLLRLPHNVTYTIQFTLTPKV